MTALEFQELKAADRLGLLPHSWRQTARICDTLVHVFCDSKQAKKVTEDMFMPGYRRSAKTRGREINSLDSLVSRMRQNYVGSPDESLG
jgi:hypothetical protein